MMLILGGTSDGLDIAKELYKTTDDIIYSTATEYGFQLSEKSFSGRVIYGRKNKEQLKEFLVENNIKLVVDATHPFAGNVSENAMKVCNELGISYVRYERKNSLQVYKGLIQCDSFEEAGRAAEGIKGIIFITTGSKDIQKILLSISDHSRVRTRVLPMSESIIKLEEIGLNSDNIIAMKGPFSEEMNYLMLKECNAAVIICKDSGDRGGTEEKLRAAERLGIKSIIIKRPEVDYINKFEKLNDLMSFIEGQLTKG